MKFLLNHMYILMTVLFAVTSQLIIKWQMSTYSFENYNSMYDKFYFALGMLTNPFIILSVALTLLSGLSWMIAMTKFDISYAYPYTALIYILTMVLTFPIKFLDYFLLKHPMAKNIASGFIYIGKKKL